MFCFRSCFPSARALVVCVLVLVITVSMTMVLYFLPGCTFTKVRKAFWFSFGGICSEVCFVVFFYKCNKLFLYAHWHSYSTGSLLLQAGCPKPNQTDDDEFPWAQFRLPRSIHPLSYELTLTPDLDKMTFTGRAIINMIALHNTKRIVLHAANLSISKATFKVWLKGALYVS